MGDKKSLLGILMMFATILKKTTMDTLGKKVKLEQIQTHSY